MEKEVEAVCAAYSNRDDSALAEALEELLHAARREAWFDGPPVLLRRLENTPYLLGVINRAACEASRTVEGRIGYAAGAFFAMVQAARSVVQNAATDEALAKIGPFGPDDLAHAETARILLAAWGYGGRPLDQIVSTVALSSGQPKEAVRERTAQLIELKMLERIEYDGGEVRYRISDLGEAVLSRLSK